ncbi:MAG: 5'/3'-nucleotidase SurE [Ruminococcaceae bacterium]|nr:5'/3'-nucleotidase SurE [Oscillospiraceae bacterium]
MVMRILITNDDGLNAPGLVPLIKWCKKHGDVTAFVPKYEQSGKSHGIEFHKPFEVKEVELEDGIKVYSVDSTPADCVRYAILGLKLEFDLIISGINRGLNIGSDILYSGTASAVFEGCRLGVKGIAISTSPEGYSTAVDKLDLIYDFFKKHDLLTRHDLYNVNIPEEIRGIKITRQGGPYYSDEFHPAENSGDHMVMAYGFEAYREDDDYEIDTNAALHGYLSVSPITIIRTDVKMFEELREINNF